jgi:hypothetical protein
MPPYAGKYTASLSPAHNLLAWTVSECIHSHKGNDFGRDPREWNSKSSKSEADVMRVHHLSECPGEGKGRTGKKIPR